MCNNKQTKMSENKKYTFVKREELGLCPLCVKKVYNDKLFVEKGREVYHYSCYNNNNNEESE